LSDIKRKGQSNKINSSDIKRKGQKVNRTKC